MGLEPYSDHVMTDSLILYYGKHINIWLSRNAPQVGTISQLMHMSFINEIKVYKYYKFFLVNTFISWLVWFDISSNSSHLQYASLEVLDEQAY